MSLPCLNVFSKGFPITCKIKSNFCTVASKATWVWSLNYLSKILPAPSPPDSRGS